GLRRRAGGERDRSAPGRNADDGIVQKQHAARSPARSADGGGSDPRRAAARRGDGGSGHAVDGGTVSIGADCQSGEMSRAPLNKILRNWEALPLNPLAVRLYYRTSGFSDLLLFQGRWFISDFTN